MSCEVNSNCKTKKVINVFKPKTKEKTSDKSGKDNYINDKDTLTQMAVDEIMRESSRAAIRAETAGPSGWLPCPLAKTNKRFLANTIKSVISHNNRKSENSMRKTEKQLDEIINKGKRRNVTKFGERKHMFKKPLKKEKEKT